MAQDNNNNYLWGLQVELVRWVDGTKKRKSLVVPYCDHAWPMPPQYLFEKPKNYPRNSRRYSKYYRPPTQKLVSAPPAQIEEIGGTSKEALPIEKTDEASADVGQLPQDSELQTSQEEIKDSTKVLTKETEPPKSTASEPKMGINTASVSPRNPKQGLKKKTYKVVGTFPGVAWNSIPLNLLECCSEIIMPTKSENKILKSATKTCKTKASVSTAGPSVRVPISGIGSLISRTTLPNEVRVIKSYKPLKRTNSSLLGMDVATLLTRFTDVIEWLMDPKPVIPGLAPDVRRSKGTTAFGLRTNISKNKTKRPMSFTGLPLKLVESRLATRFGTNAEPNMIKTNKIKDGSSTVGVKSNGLVPPAPSKVAVAPKLKKKINENQPVSAAVNIASPLTPSVKRISTAK